MLILILLDVQYFQNFVFTFEEGWNGKSHSLPDFHHSKKNFSSAEFSILDTEEENFLYPLTLFGKTCTNMRFSRKNDVSSLSIWESVPTRQTAHGNFLIICQMVLLPNVKKTRHQNVEPVTELYN